MARVEWRARARRDVERLAVFLWEKQPEAAARGVSVIMEGARLLESSPRLGRPMGDGTGRRELSLPFGAGAYILRYMLKDDNLVLVLRVWHSRESRAE
jgi:plasmid stabilization system protein ParE